ncbi:hypothetical protein [Pedobacter sp. Hv1]|uniref:hypothetical protein n=1 Tax=Pedobacter sp. Hv1 TaxID=1740090 RepID=UPI0006D89D17|nr:hypothetical protein [Pedobacter sp. Hv1]KQC00686.1 hypothetical protein AQF98_08380 [Pedobacter sp. Hv1]
MRKTLTRIMLIMLLLCPIMSLAQRIDGITYRADKWADLTKYKSWAQAMDNPKYEKVAVFINDKEVQLLKGKNLQTYIITKRINGSNEQTINFKINYNNKIYDLKVFEIEGSTFFKMEGLWMIEFLNENRQIIYK